MRRRARGRFAAVHGERFAVRCSNQQQATPAQPRVETVHHSQRQRRGDRSINGISSLFHGIDGGVGGQSMNGGGGTMRGGFRTEQGELAERKQRDENGRWAKKKNEWIHPGSKRTKAKRGKILSRSFRNV